MRFRVCKPQLTGNVSDIVPLSLFLLTSNTLRVSFKHWGIVPFNKLSDRSRTTRYVALHIDSGIRPNNLLLERDKKKAPLCVREMPAGITGITEVK